MQTSTLLSAASTRRLLTDSGRRGDATRKKLLALCDTHDSHKQQSLYRAGASVTAFRVRDPDPNAVDGGRVLGLRFDVMMAAQFLRPYYVLLNRDDDDKSRNASLPSAPSRLRIHRHTIPSAVPLGGLAARHLGATRRRSASAPNAAESPIAPASDLYAFARALRRALVRYHNRLAVIGDLRRSVQARTAAAAPIGDQTDHQPNQPIDVSGADAEAKHVRFDWADGRTGRLLLDDDGAIEQMVVIGATGARDRAAARALLAGETTATGLVRRMSGA